MTTLVVTRPQPQADQWVERLQAMGQPALALPLLRILPSPGHANEVDKAWAALVQKRHVLVMFVSPNAVLQFFAARPANVDGWIDGVMAASTGPGTVKALLSVGVPAESVLSPAEDSPQFDAEALWQQHLAGRVWAGQSALIVRGESGRDWLAEVLRAHGATVSLIAAYRRLGPDWDDVAVRRAWARLVTDPRDHAWLFSSSEAVRALNEHLKLAGDTGELLRSVAAVATHERIAMTARGAGFRDVRPSRPDPESIRSTLACHPQST
jgi:uroporphyrinogen-III synthase